MSENCGCEKDKIIDELFKFRVEILGLLGLIGATDADKKAVAMIKELIKIKLESEL